MLFRPSNFSTEGNEAQAASGASVSLTRRFSVEQLHAVRKESEAMSDTMSFSLVDLVLGAQGVNKIVLLTHAEQ